MKRCTVWAVIGEDTSRWKSYRGPEFRPRGVIGYLAMDGEGIPAMFAAGGIAMLGQPDFGLNRIMQRIEGLLLRPMLASGEPDTSDAARGGAMFVDGAMRVMDLASFKAAMDAYYKSETARMPSAAKPSRPGVGFPVAAFSHHGQIKSGPTKSPAIPQLVGKMDRKALASQAA